MLPRLVVKETFFTKFLIQYFISVTKNIFFVVFVFFLVLVNNINTGTNDIWRWVGLLIDNENKN